ncbi:hypothetical protein HF086_010936 [Spodoptera exigua]|uniref:RFX-type winged-helix domain-containing protein n=1 Tax=Spodoptera exigua TaxID=7107 RepID=A0A922MHX0_SPOEX|nr:hypothetical protein HF086_010936 [Spodoptera exigua]
MRNTRNLRNTPHMRKLTNMIARRNCIIRARPPKSVRQAVRQRRWRRCPPLQQSHLQQRTVQENEHFAQAWLRSAYEVLPASDNSACDANDLYRQYLACCTKLSRKGVIAPAHFPRLVRTVFGGTVGPNTVTLSTGETQQVYIGIRSRALQNRPNPPAGPSSPILKAQLTNKAAAEAKPAVSQPQTQPQAQPTTSHPHLSQALESSPSNTTLIKHLLAHKVAQRQQSQQRTPATTPATVVVQNNQQVMDVDPEALIKCTTITPGGVASSTPTDKVHVPEEPVVPKEEPVQIQIDEQTQLTIKSAQNKMLADLLKKNSNPPLQVVQMGPQINAPTIQITETGQIVQVKSDPTPVIQINDSGLVAPGNQYFQIKNEQGQVIQIKNDQGQIIQLKSDQLQAPILQYKNEQGQLVQLKTEGQVQMKTEKEEPVPADHSYTEPPAKKTKVEEKAPPPQESVSKTAANLYAALAASALEDEEDLLPPKQDPVEIIQPSVLVSTAGDNSVIIQEPILQVQPPPLTVQQPTMQVHQPTLQVQQPTLQVQAPLQQTIQVQQPMLQVQPMDVQNIIASQAGQIILQEKSISSQPTQYVQQPMQIIATPSNAQGNQQLLQGSQQIIAVSNTQPIIVNTPMKSNVHRVVQQPQRSPVVTSVQSHQVSVVSEAKTSVIQSPVIRQPVMVGNTKIGDKELVVNQPVTEALTAVYYSRRHAAGEGADGKPVTLNYPPNAALAALNKHAADMFNPRELMDENEGPVTKSIRLTAALILRNIVIYSNTGRRQLRSYEAHLATIALSSVEASRTIAQVLYDMNNI